MIILRIFTNLSILLGITNIEEYSLFIEESKDHLDEKEKFGTLGRNRVRICFSQSLDGF